MKTLVYSIAKQENKYIREWVEHYKDLGFTNVCIYDNNDDGGESFNDVIGDYIDSKYVIIVNYRGLPHPQLKAHQDCYNTFGDKYDWLAFFDTDEYLELVNTKSIEEYLSQDKFKEFDCIKINWRILDDNDHVYYSEGKLSERFTRYMKEDKCLSYPFPENNHVKSIVRGHMNVIWNNPHVPTLPDNKYCNNCGNRDRNSPFSQYDFSEAFLKHYHLKSAEEYLWKIYKGRADINTMCESVNERKTSVEGLFFRENKITKEKVDVISKGFGIDFSYLLNNR